MSSIYSRRRGLVAGHTGLLDAAVEGYLGKHGRTTYKVQHAYLRRPEDTPEP
jgi:hypothetical protein